MADLVVDTRQLHSAGVQLSEVARVAQDLGGRGGRLSPLIPAVGRDGAAQAVASFLSNWVYGVGWIGMQAEECSRTLVEIAVAYEGIDRQLAAAARGESAPPMELPSCVTATPSREPTRPNWTQLDSLISRVPVQLSAAEHPSQLIPGDPEEVRRGARLLTGFAKELGETRSTLGRVSLSAKGATMEVLEQQLTELQGRLAHADVAFSSAADALTSYSESHTSALALAKQALTIWQAAKPASDLARGAVVAGSVATSLLPKGVDPDSELARAAAILATAREILEAAERRLIPALQEAEKNSPNDPGKLAIANRSIASFSIGVAEGLSGGGAGLVEMATLVARLSPGRLAGDPSGWWHDVNALWDGAVHGVKDWKGTGKALIDWETWASDPARAAGKIAPTLLAGLGAVKAGGTLRGSAAARRLREDADLVLGSDALHPMVGPGKIQRVLDRFQLSSRSPAGQAVTTQMKVPHGNPDLWIPATLRPGQRLVLYRQFAASADNLPVSAREFFEDHQMHPNRSYGTEGEVGPSGYPSGLRIVEVQEEFDAAAARALANPRWGAGGGTHVFVPDINDAIRSGALKDVDEWHMFDPQTLSARFEDPDFKAVDPKLPHRPLDPAREATLGRLDATSDQVRDFLSGAAVSASVDHLNAPEEPVPTAQGDR